MSIAISVVTVSLALFSPACNVHSSLAAVHFKGRNQILFCRHLQVGSKCCVSSFNLLRSLSFHHPIIPSTSPSHSLFLHAVSRRTLSEVRSESASVCRQPWKPCPNWPMAWQDDCQLLSVRAVHADRQQGWTAPDGSFKDEKESLFPFPSCLSLEIICFRESEALVGTNYLFAAWYLCLRCAVVC